MVSVFGHFCIGSGGGGVCGVVRLGAGFVLFCICWVIGFFVPFSVVSCHCLEVHSCFFGLK